MNHVLVDLICFLSLKAKYSLFFNKMAYNPHDSKFFAKIKRNSMLQLIFLTPELELKIYTN